MFISIYLSIYIYIYIYIPVKFMIRYVTVLSAKSNPANLKKMPKFGSDSGYFLKRINYNTYKL